MKFWIPDKSDPSARVRWTVALTFGVVAIVATGCVWAGLSVTDLLSVIRAH